MARERHPWSDEQYIYGRIYSESQSAESELFAKTAQEFDAALRRLDSVRETNDELRESFKWFLVNIGMGQSYEDALEDLQGALYDRRPIWPYKLPR